MIKNTLILLTFFFVTSNTFAQLAKKVAKLDSVLTYLHENQFFNGTILVGENGKIVYKKAFGIANIATKEPLNIHSAFNLASVSKQFFCMMTMILKEQGKLQYDDKVQKYLPQFPYEQITIRQLMNQTTGLPEYFDIADRNMTPLDTLTNATMLEMLAIQKPSLSFQPNEKWEYCNTNYTTLASVIEKVAGMKAELFFQEKIAKPLKLKNTYIYHLKMPFSPKNRVLGFKYEDGKMLSDDLMRFDGIIGDGNVYSSVEDLYTWEQALYTEKLVKQSTMQEAFQSSKLNNGELTKYGFGWFIVKPDTLLAHTGGWVGFRTLICRYLDKKQTLIVLGSSGESYHIGIARAILEDRTYELPQTQLISNVKLVDGTGVAARPASVRILGNRVKEIGDLQAFPNEKVTDGKGLVLAPGFIDSHSHHYSGLEENPEGIAALNQGITTIVIGQDGGSYSMDSLEVQLKRVPASVNVATYTGHTTLRMKAMGAKGLFRKASKEEVEKMKVHLQEEMQKGSLGLATGLEYERAFFSNKEEVIDLAKVTAKEGGRYISHIRSEDINIEEAIEEIINIGREAKLPVQISHVKIAMRSKWETSAKALSRIQEARNEGINITADCYPYDFWRSTLRVLFPKRDYDNLASAEFATKELFDPEQSILVAFAPNPSYEGKTIGQIAKINTETSAQTLMRLIKEAEIFEAKNPDYQESIEGVMGKSMSESDIKNFLQWNHTNICSDGTNGGHPRGHGAFTRVLGRYVREQKIMSLESAIYKMTGLTAEHLGLQSRGMIKAGYFADLVLLNPDNVIDNATVTKPTALSTGIEAVWVNGQIVFQNQQATKVYSGIMIKR